MTIQSDEKCIKKTNLLVYQKPTGEREERRHPCVVRKKPTYNAPVCTSKPKHIRVCTGAELKKMCPPKLCDCRPPRKSAGLLGLLGFGLKVAIAAAAVYVSYDLGIWGTTENTQELYKSYCSAISEPQKRKSEKWESPSCQEERELFKVPPFNPYERCNTPPFDHEMKTYNMQVCWNNAVQYVFAGIAGFPNNVIEKFSKREKKDNVQKQEIKCTPIEDLPEEERIINSYK